MNHATLSNLARQVMLRCDELGAFSEESFGLTRRFLSTPMQDVHRVVSDWMREAGMSVRVDQIGNIVGRRLSQSSGPVKTLLMGSHLDTVPNAGKYDGPLGVLIGIAVVEALRDVSLPFHIDVIGFSEEEGVRYAQPYLGSRAIGGTFDPSWLERRDDHGISMREAIIDFGLDPRRISEAAYRSEDVLGFIEAHIEQGIELEQRGSPVAVVDTLVGQSRIVVRFIGQAAHAGTVPMSNRRDALVGAAHLIQAVSEIGKSIEGLRATVGKLTVTPNASNVVPDEVEMSLDVRHAMDSIRRVFVDRILRLGEATACDLGLSFEMVHRHDTNSMVASVEFVDRLSQAIRDESLESISLHSYAGHDAVVMGELFPFAMLFIRHPGGISHHPDETVLAPDVEVAIRVLTRFIRNLGDKVTSQ